MTESENEAVGTVDHTIYGDSSTYVISDGLDQAPEKKPRKTRAVKEKQKKTKVQQLQDSHIRKSAKAAVSIIEASAEQYAESTCDDTLQEATAAIDECHAASERLCQLEAQLSDAPANSRKRSTEDDKPKEKKAKTGAGGERYAAEFKKLREKFERLASLFGANSARCTAATRRAAEPVTALISSVAGSRDCIAASKDREKHVFELRAANGNLNAFSADEHPILALAVGANGKSVLTTTTSTIPRLNAAAMTVDYLAYSIPRADLAPQRLAWASMQKTKNAAQRLLREQKKGELALRRSIAMSQFQIADKPS